MWVTLSYQIMCSSFGKKICSRRICLFFKGVRLCLGQVWRKLRSVRVFFLNTVPLRPSASLRTSQAGHVLDISARPLADIYKHINPIARICTRAKRTDKVILASTTIDLQFIDYYTNKKIQR
jgi:hypothetical protein